ncbi:Gfo/Idh/MocA family oxidoreductase [Ruficoccus amylovorans]|uniref:Gfo/Idh/MocA family oxidoreductase n=1 Tax=Ruficoccus amylovorans TaxID=1804625 RepID=A0A842HLJ7_9BACT|nr:Gfo/Idh/MocA family oxidoreductase [Ruficoccus amylovorans]MBC2596001.1 Gfo/Idh/MocA family oxidoreductase [Ruficoccus amylovorans]
MNDQPIRLAQIGVGGFGHYHTQALLQMEERGWVRLAAAVDPALDLEKNLVLREEWQRRSTRCFGELRECLRQMTGQLDAVLIVTPIPYHFEMALACVDADLFVYLEKPPVATVRQLELLLKHPKSDRIAVGFNRSCWPCFREMKAAIGQGRLGKLRSLRASALWPRPRAYYERAAWAGRLAVDGLPVFDGPASNALAHLVMGLFQLLAAQCGPACSVVDLEAEFYRAHEIESYDTLSLTARMEDGVEMIIALSHACLTELPATIEIRGDEATGIIDVDSGFSTVNGVVLTDVLGGSYYAQLVDCYENFCRGVQAQSGTDFNTNLEDTRGYLTLLETAYAVAKGIRTVGKHHLEYDEKNMPGCVGIRDIPVVLRELMNGARLFSRCPSASWARSGQANEACDGLRESLAFHSPGRT